MAEYLFRRRLTDSEMGGIEAAIAISDTHIDAFEAAVVEFYAVAVTEALGIHYADASPVDPAQYAIPEDQWTAIAALLIRSTGDLTGLLAGMRWMTYGPAIYTD